MVKAQLAFAAIVIAALFSIFGIWFAVTDYQSARDGHQKFFRSPQPPLTSGGEKMKIEW